MKKILISFYYIQTILLYICNAIKLNSIALSYSPEDHFFNSVANDFNKYAKEQGLDVELDVNLITFNNSSNLAEDYKTNLEILREKNSKKYDIYFYDIAYASIYFNNLLELDDLLPSNHLALYKSGIASQTCKYNGKWIGLPVDVNYRVLYSNSKLLEEYGKILPKTWDEMLNIGEKILNEERKKGNNDLIGYNGFIPEYENNLSSVEEFIYSYRISKDSSYPKYGSSEALRALIALKEIKNKLSSDEIFQSNDMYSISKLKDGNAIFLKFWTFPKVNSVYNITILLGDKEGISGSAIGGYNIGIDKNINKEKKKFAIEALEYITSWDTQKRYLINDHVLSAIDELYNDQEVCHSIDCNLIKSIQSFSHSYDENYYKKFKTYIYDYLYGKASAKNVLDSIVDIKKIYFIRVDPSESFEGLIIFITTSLIIVIILFSTRLLFDIKFREFFKFLTIDLWLLTIFGDLIILSSVFPEYGMRTSVKCKLRYILLSLGYNISITPILYKIINKSPHEDIFKQKVCEHKKIFLSTVIGINIVLSLLLLLTPNYDIEDQYGLDDKKFQICKMNNIYGKIVLFFTYLFIVLIMITMIFYSISKWSINENKDCLKTYISLLCIDSIFFILFSIFYMIKFGSYTLQFLIPALIADLIGLMNYGVVYGTKAITLLRKKKYISEMNMKHMLNDFSTTSESNSRNDAVSLKSLYVMHQLGKETIIENSNFG